VALGIRDVRVGFTLLLECIKVSRYSYFFLGLFRSSPVLPINCFACHPTSHTVPTLVLVTP